MRTTEEKETMPPYWMSSANWPVADGSLEGSINLVTASSASEDDVIPTGVLLKRPPAPDSPPCEITISFREKHEIHSIYVRSSARIYEIYYATDNNVDSNEYLCTVHCGAAAQEDTSAVLPWTDSNYTTEDGWVEIKVPDSLLLSQYEATAEISDSSPCMSIRLRLLSLQIKTYICIDEICISADPTEDNYPDPPVTATGAGSLLSMLVPGLLHLSKSGRFQPKDQSFSDATAGSIFLSSTDKSTDARFPDMSNTSEAEASSVTGNSNIGLDPYHVSKFKNDENLGVPGCVETALDEPTGKKLADKVKCSDQSQNATNSETNYARLEKILGDLMSRVERIENVCLSFQKSLLKPLTEIDNRLHRMEEQLYVFSKATPVPSETDPSSRISCLSDHNSNAENEGCILLTASMESSYHETAATAIDNLMVPLPESLKNPGLVVKAPEFPDEEDGDGDDDDIVDDDESPSDGNAVDLITKECPPKGTLLSIDRALSSALTAFITSTTDRSHAHNPNPMDVPADQQFSDNHSVDSSYGAVLSVVEWVLEDKNCDVSNEVPDITLQRIKSFSDAHDLDNTVQKTVEWVLEDKNCDVSYEVPNITLQRKKSFSDAHDLDNTVQKNVEWVLEDKNCDVSYVVQDSTLQGNESFSDAHNLDNTVQKTVEWVLEDKSCDVSYEAPEIITLQRKKSFSDAHDLDNIVQKTVDWVLEDKNCDLSYEAQDIPLRRNKSFAEAHDIDDILLKTVEWVLEDKNCDVSSEAQDMTLRSNKFFSDAHNFDIILQTTVQCGLKDKNCNVSFEPQCITLRRNKSLSAVHDLDSTLPKTVDWVLEDNNCDASYESQDITRQRNKSFSAAHDLDSTLQEICTFTGTEAKTQLNCSCDESLLLDNDSSAANGPKDLIIRAPGLPCDDDVLNCSKISNFSVSDHPDSNSDVLPLFLPSRTSLSKSSSNLYDEPSELSSGYIFIRSNLLPESFESGDMDSIIRAESAETSNVISPMTSHYELKQASSSFSSQFDLVSNIGFNADETLKSWLPLEVLLGEKSDGELQNGKDLIGNLGFPPEILDDKLDVQIESSDYASYTGIPHVLNSLVFQSLSQRSETVDNTLLDMTYNIDRSEFSGIVKDSPPNNHVCFSSKQPFSSLI